MEMRSLSSLPLTAQTAALFSSSLLRPSKLQPAATEDPSEELPPLFLFLSHNSGNGLPSRRATANPGGVSLSLASLEAELRWWLSYAIDDGGVQQLPLPASSSSFDGD
nr:hypothetical protein Iba_chr13dCG6920 [Ipomoea batatas]